MNFINDNDQKKIWNIFQWDLAPQIYEIFEEKYPIKTNPLYCYKPLLPFLHLGFQAIELRDLYLCQGCLNMMPQNILREKVFYLNSKAKNDNEQEYIKELGTTEWDKFNLKESKTYKKEEERLINLIEENNNNAAYWSKRNMMFNFEHVVSKPESFVDYLMSRFDIEFDEDLLKKGIIMDKRPLENVVELDFIKIESTLKELGCSDKTMNYVINQQKRYLDNL